MQDMTENVRKTAVRRETAKGLGTRTQLYLAEGAILCHTTKQLIKLFDELMKCKYRFIFHQSYELECQNGRVLRKL